MKEKKLEFQSRGDEMHLVGIWRRLQVRIRVIGRRNDKTELGVVDRGARESDHWQNLRCGRRRKEHKFVFRSEKGEYILWPYG